ncbi:MAG TPA: nuclear transport factor 2 family protein [Gammaproteobacteria bacterium]
MSIEHRPFAWLLLLAFTAAAGCASHPAERSHDCAIAQRYLEASNTGNASLIAPHLADDVTAVFLAEDGAAHSVLQGKADVMEAVRTYTAQCPSCRSTLRCLHVTPHAAYAIEDVVFTDQDGVERRQSAPLVLELDGDTVEAIVYYPSPDKASENP